MIEGFGMKCSHVLGKKYVGYYTATYFIAIEVRLVIDPVLQQRGHTRDAVKSRSSAFDFIKHNPFII